MTSEHSERLPLPHTKGTKPAPLLTKSISLLFMSQEKNYSLFEQNFTNNSTEGGTRTPTSLHPPDFESGASTNSATPAI